MSDLFGKFNLPRVAAREGTMFVKSEYYTEILGLWELGAITEDEEMFVNRLTKNFC